MEMLGMNIKTIAYIESEAEFNRAKVKGFWQALFGLVTGQTTQLRSFAEAIEALYPHQTANLGLQDVPLKNIVGSVGRDKDFTCRFLPRTSNPLGKDRWRRIYTLAVTGEGFPPVELYKIGQDYFVEDGHHRVSVARYLAWDTIQANVIELLPPIADLYASNNQLDLCNGVELCIQS